MSQFVSAALGLVESCKNWWNWSNSSDFVVSPVSRHLWIQKCLETGETTKSLEKLNSSGDFVVSHVSLDIYSVFFNLHKKLFTHIKLSIHRKLTGHINSSCHKSDLTMKSDNGERKVMSRDVLPVALFNLFFKLVAMRFKIQQSSQLRQSITYCLETRLASLLKGKDEWTKINS